MYASAPTRRKALLLVTAAMTLSSVLWASNANAMVKNAGSAPSSPATTFTNGCAGKTWQVVDRHTPLSYTWRDAHDGSYGSDYKSSTSGGTLTLACARGHNGEDGWKPRESPDFNNKGILNEHDVYITGNRDDCIENDDFMSGTVSNVLCDGTFTFMSEQYQGSGASTSIGSGESPWIYVNNTYAFIHNNNAPSVMHVGRYFKWMPRGLTSHKLDITDSVFAIDEPPTSETGSIKWDHVSFPTGTVFHGSNFVLWLGNPGAYQGQKPSGVTFLEGQAAKDKWNEVRNGWLVAHGFAPRPVTDFSSIDDPAVAPTGANR